MAQLSPAENPIFPYFGERINNLPTVPQKGRYIFCAKLLCVCVAALKTFPSPRLRLSVIDRTSRFFAEGKSLRAGVWEKQLVNLGGGGEIFGTKVGAAADIYPTGCLFLSGEEYNFPFPNDATGKKNICETDREGEKQFAKLDLGPNCTGYNVFIRMC